MEKVKIYILIFQRHLESLLILIMINVSPVNYTENDCTYERHLAMTEIKLLFQVLHSSSLKTSMQYFFS